MRCWPTGCCSGALSGEEAGVGAPGDSASVELSDGEIRLRPPLEEDAAEIARAVQSSLEELSRWMPWAVEGYDAGMALAWIRGKFDPTGENFLILGPDCEIVGTCGLNRFDPTNARAELGYWLRSDRTGRGFATRATRLVARYGIEELGLHRIEIIMSTRNDPSRRVAERVGARHEGVLHGRIRLPDGQHDGHMYSIVADERTGGVPNHVDEPGTARIPAGQGRE